ncbi:MAG: putative Ig domain-containing protein [Leptospiraceae bacterium]|nr:putative Ig domain-containing protein [Leptospiraceae bacterium]MCP5498497.1 putative Ig domain-containing protein [Leptospiraceae bacterium]
MLKTIYFVISLFILSCDFGLKNESSLELALSRFLSLASSSSNPTVMSVIYPSAELSLTVGVSNLFAPTQADNVSSFQITPNLPEGLSFDTLTGTISGTPTAALSRTEFTITATRTGEVQQQQLFITVTDPAAQTVTTPLSIRYPATYTSYQYSPITISPTLTGTLNSCSISPALPSGLSLNTTNCIISGSSSTELVSTTYTITAKNDTEIATSSITISIQKVSLITLDFPISSYTYDTSQTISIRPTTTGTISSCSASPSLPSGLTLDTTSCAISGTATTTQSSTSYTLTASNSTYSVSKTINLTINPGFSYTYTRLTYLVYSSSDTVSPTYTMPSDTICSISPTLPSGLKFDKTTCSISGIPDTLYNSSIKHTVTAINSNGTYTATLSISVSEGTNCGGSISPCQEN